MYSILPEIFHLCAYYICLIQERMYSNELHEMKT